MIRYECLKLFYNKRTVAFLLLLVTLNCAYFWYHGEKGDIPAHAYRELTSDLQGQSADEAVATLAQKKSAVKTSLYEPGENGAAQYRNPEYCDNLWQEKTLFTVVSREYEDVAEYPSYLAKIIQTEKNYLQMTAILGTDEKLLADIEKTGRDYERITGLEISFTRTRGIAEAVSLPSTIFLEMLVAVLFASLLFAKEKEQGLLRLYSSMYHGRGRMFGARAVAISLGVIVSNFLFSLSSLFIGCFLYGKPEKGFLSQPLQALAGYKASAWPISIGEFLFLSFLWTCFVTILVALLAAVLSSFLSSTMKVYVVLFAFIGIEGILYLSIEKREYLAILRRINLVSFADAGYSIGEYHNEVILGKAFSYWTVALALVLCSAVLLFVVGWILSDRGFGLSTEKRSRFRRKHNRDDERIAGSHFSVFLHEMTKFFRFEKVGVILLLALCYVLFFTKPYHNYFETIEQVFYQTYIARLSEVEPSEYKTTVEEFRTELEEEKRKTNDTRSIEPKERAFHEIEEYVGYLLTKPGARAVDSRGFELLYRNHKKNVILGVAALLAAILCGTAMFSVEYRTGVSDFIRISPERKKVLCTKLLILLATILVFYGFVYGRYLFQVLRGYGTSGIGLQANSIRDLADVPAKISIGTYLTLLYIKRFFGLILATLITVLLVRKLKSFLLTAVAALAILIVPLLLCLADLSAVRWISLNWFFV